MIEHTADFVTWKELGTYRVTDRDIRVRDFGASNAPVRFYRARSAE